MNKTLLVGCGGSGSQTLMRLNAMLASNPECRKWIYENMAYLVVDLEADELKSFTDEIKRQMGQAGMPVIKTLQLSQGITTLNTIVNANMKYDEGDEKLERLKKYWWFNKETNEPFEAVNISNLPDGAGQCCAASYLCAWDYLPRLSEDIENILGEMENRNTDDPRPLEGLKVYIVTSLAGGTGRGIWNLIAFKINQCLKKRNLDIRPEAVFFDATCFAKVKDINASVVQRDRVRLNSMTGISELSAWFKLENADNEAYNFTLPNLQNPDKDGKNDVIDAVKYAKGNKTYRCPLSASYIVFGNNGNGTLNVSNGRNEYYEMASGALYSLIAANFITKRIINSSQNLNSFASCTFEIDTINIRKYMELSVRSIYCDSLLDADDGGLENEANQCVKAFFGKTQLNFDHKMTSRDLVPLRYDSQQRKYEGDNKTLTGLIMGAIYKKDGTQLTDEDRQKYGHNYVNNSTETIYEYLIADNVEDVLNELETTLTKSWSRDKEVNKILQEYGLDENTIPSTVMKYVNDAIFYNGHASLGRAERFIELLIEKLECIIDPENKEKGLFSTLFIEGLPNYIVIDKNCNSEEFKEKLANAFRNAFKSCATRKITLSNLVKERGIKHFDNTEIKELTKAYEEFIRGLLFFDFRKTIAITIDGIIDALENIQNTLLSKIKYMVNAAKEDFESDLKRSFDKFSTIEIYRELFTENTPQAIYDSLPEANSTSVKYRRVLKPIMDKDEVDRMLRAPENISVINDPIQERFSKSITDLITDPSMKEEKILDKIVPDLVAVISDNVALRDGFLEDKFSFWNVLERNVDGLNNLLQTRRVNQDKFDEVKDKILHFYGVDQADFNEKTGKLDAMTIFKAMVCSLAIVCKPWIEIREDKKAASGFQALNIAVPIEMLERDVTQIKNNYANRVGNSVTIDIQTRTDINKKLISSDRIVASAVLGVTAPEHKHFPIKYVQSAEYWREIMEKLKMAESDDYESYFYKNAEQDVPFGFVSPIFLSKELKELRWKPWLDDNDSLGY